MIWGITPKKSKIENVKDTILRYSHIGIYAKMSASYLNDEVCRMATDKQTHK